MLTRDDRDAIEGLFRRLDEAERRGGPRDREAEELIRALMARQPASPYYLAQTVIVQQQALNEAERRIEELESRGRQPERRNPWGNAATDDQPVNRNYRSGGFLAGAAETALGVAGGMMLASLIGSIFSVGSANASEASQDDTSSDAGAEDSGQDSGDGGFDGGDGFDIGGDF